MFTAHLAAPQMEPGFRVNGLAILAGSGRVTGQVSDPVFDQVLSFNMRVYHGVVSTVTPFRQTNIHGFGSVPVTALPVYLFQLVPTIFTYLRADCPRDVTVWVS